MVITFVCLFPTILFLVESSLMAVRWLVEIRTALKTSRSYTAPGSGGIQTLVLQLCELEEDELNVHNSHSILIDNRNIVPDKGYIELLSPFQRRVIDHLLKTSVVLQIAAPSTNSQTSFFLLAYVTSSNRNCWESKVVFVLGGQQLNKHWSYVTYLTCATYQDV